MSKGIKILILVVVCVFGFCLIRDFLIKSLIGTVTSAVTGAPVHIGGLSFSVIKQSITISDFKMYNPKGFPNEILVDIPKLGVDCDLGALFKGKIHLKRIDFELKELCLTKNKAGGLNVDSLKVIEEQKSGKAQGSQKPAPQMAMQIDLANLAIGKIIRKDYSVKGPVTIKLYDVNLKKSYKNITSAQQLVVLIVAEPLKAAGIQGLKVYAVSMLAGVAALPVAAVFTFTGKDYAQASFKVTMAKAYDVGLEVLKGMGVIKKENRASGIISATVNGSGIAFKIKKVDESTTEITISARQLGFPRPEIAEGILYQITDRLK